MKKVLFLFVLISGFAFGQMENFVIENNQVRWNKVYETTKTFDELKEAVRSNAKLKITSETENSLTGEFSDLVMNYKKAGFSYMSTPMILNETNAYHGGFKIDFKEGRYRATITNAKTGGKTLSVYSGGIGLGSQINTTMEIMALNNKGEVRKAFPKVAGKILDTTFTDFMDLNTQNTDDSDW